MPEEKAQLELFNVEEHQRAVNKNVSSIDSVYVKKIRDYKKIIFSLIGVMFVALAAFSAGMEKGKKLALRGIQTATVSVLHTTQNTTPVINKSPVIIPVKELPVKEASVLAKNIAVQGIPLVTAPEQKPKNLNTAKSNYTIQVASIAQNKYVTSELSQLKNKGYSAFSLVKGKYTVIYVGKFGAKEEAQNILPRLRADYPDCQIRRL